MVYSMLLDLSLIIQAKLEKQRKKLEEESREKTRRVERENRHKPTDIKLLRFYETKVKLFNRNNSEITEKKVFLLGNVPEQKPEWIVSVSSFLKGERVVFKPLEA